MGRKKAYTGLWWGNLRERNCLKVPGVDGRLIVRWIVRSWMWGMYCVDVAQDRGRWRELVNAVMKLRVPQNAGNSLTS